MKKLLVILLVLALLVSCSNNPATTSSTETVSTEMVELSNVNEYTIIMPSDRSDAVKDMAMLLRETLGEIVGGTMPFSTDKKDAADDVKEILIGNTSRAQSAVEVKYNDYIVKNDGNKIVIKGGSDNATVEAVEWFIKTCIVDNKVSVPSTPYEVKRDYSYETIKVNSVFLKDYAVEDENLAGEIAKLTGHIPEKDGENKVIFSKDETLGAFDLSVQTVGANIEIKLKDTESVYGVSGALANVLGKEDHQSINTVVTLKTDMLEELSADTLATWQSESDAKKAAILSTPNMEIPSGATVYYVSNSGKDTNDGKTPATAFATIEKVNSVTMASGSYVLFERGGFWRGQVLAQEGVTYSAYGEGNKPTLVTSPENAADPNKWTKVSDTVWSFDTLHWGYENWISDVGTMIFNEGEAWAIKYIPYQGKAYGTDIPFTSGADIKEDLAFFHDTGRGILYLCSKENPGTRFNSIEFNIRLNVFAVHQNNNVTVDNICVKYTGAHGVGAGTVKNLTVQNCEFGWIGGSYHMNNPTYGYPIRFGNAVQIYGGCDGYYVRNNYIYQIYDTAITHQFADYEIDPTDPSLAQKNIEYIGNVIEYTVLPFEYWLGLSGNNHENGIENFVVKDNYAWHTGEGLGAQRPDKDVAGFFITHAHVNYHKNVLFENNVFVGTTVRLFDIYTNRSDENGVYELPTFKNNHFASTDDVLFGCIDAREEKMKEYTPKILTEYKHFFNGDKFYIIKD